MTVHWVNYDLNRAGQNYDGLIAYLKSHQGWAKPHQSSFFIKTTLTASQLRDGIKKHVDSNDTVVVVTVDGASWATTGVSATINEWLKRNL